MILYHKLEMTLIEIWPLAIELLKGKSLAVSSQFLTGLKPIAAKCPFLLSFV